MSEYLKKMKFICICGHRHSEHRSMHVDDICLGDKDGKHCECSKYVDVGWEKK